MSVTAFAQGTQTATISTEHTLASVNQAGVYQGWVDLRNMAAGDVLELRVYRMVKTSGTVSLLDLETFTGVVPSGLPPVYRTEGYANPNTDTDALKFTLKQTAGTGRSFDYSVDKVA